MPDSLYLQTFDQCVLNLFLLARSIPDGVLLIFPYLFIPSGSGRSSRHVLPDFSHPYTKRLIRRRPIGSSDALSSGSDTSILPATGLAEPQVTPTILVLTPGVEPGTSSLPMKCSTA